MRLFTPFLRFYNPYEILQNLFWWPHLEESPLPKQQDVLRFDVLNVGALIIRIGFLKRDLQ